MTVMEAALRLWAKQAGKGWSRGATFVPRKACAVCGTAFYAPPSQVKRGGGVVCSVACRTHILHVRRLAKRVPTTCRQCRQTQMVAPSIAAKRLHCSMACLKASRVLPVRPCRTCARAITGKGETYCSMACAVKQRPSAAQRPIGICEVCGKKYRVAVGSMGRVCSMRCVGGLAAARNAEQGYSRTKGGRRPDLENRYFRSSWEANWARYLNFLKQQGQITGWDYEPDVFEFQPIKRGSRFYTPDFKVYHDTGSYEYHEVKGWMDQRSRTKLKRMAKYYPQVKIVLVEKALYTDVARKIGKMLPGWEWNMKHSN